MHRFINTIYFTVIPFFLFVIAFPKMLFAEQIGEGECYQVMELAFEGPNLTPADTPARDINFRAIIEHESGLGAHMIYGFWDGDGQGGKEGNVFKIRFNPTSPGKWLLRKVYSSNQLLNGQHEGDTIKVNWSDNPGFWIIDPHSAGQRWYMRSDDSHQYIFGNTHYSFLSGYGPNGEPTNNSIEEDLRGNAEYFKKLRFGLHGDYYPHPKIKPYLDENGKPADVGNYSHRPNPEWFHKKVDLAVQTAYDEDLIADLILAGPDTENSRSTLRAAMNDGDPEPYLKYIAARYGSYPNVWICLVNEYDIRTPTYTEAEIVRYGQILRKYLPYPTPVSVHSTPKMEWPAAFDTLPPWNDHQIIQNKLKQLGKSADTIQNVRDNTGGVLPRMKPTINDELSYQGAGDGHEEEDTIEAMFGAFLGGGYGTTGSKPGSKIGQYFLGNFDPEKHSAADNLLWLRKIIDSRISFWNMEPDLSVFQNLDLAFRGMAWARHEYVLGTSKQKEGILATLPEGSWVITRYDVIKKEASVIGRGIKGTFEFDSPESRAVLFHFVNELPPPPETGYHTFP